MSEGSLPGPTREQLASILEGQLRHSLASAATAGVPAWMLMRPNRFYAAHIQTPGGGWAVQNDTLKISSLVSSGLAAAAVYKENGPPMKELITIGVALVALIWLVHDHGASLDRPQILILAALKASPEQRASGWKVDELCERINSTVPDDEQPWTLADVEQSLTSLTEVRLKNGKVVPFVASTSDGLWSANNV